MFICVDSGFYAIIIGFWIFFLMILGFDYRSFRIAIFCSCFSVRTIVFLVLCVSFKLIVVVHVIWLDFVVFSETATEELLFVMFFPSDLPSVWLQRKWRKSLIVDCCVILGYFFPFIFLLKNVRRGKIGKLNWFSFDWGEESNFDAHLWNFTLKSKLIN